MPEYPIYCSDTLHQIYPQATVGVMILEDVTNPKSSPELDGLKQNLEIELRKIFQNKTALRAHPTLEAYAAYYKNFKKTYHVLPQIESLIFGGRSLPNSAALVEAMFMAELKNMLLTAGHDLCQIEIPIQINTAQGNESYTMMNGAQQTLKAKDMYMADKQGIISSVIYGPDRRTRIQPGTRQVLFVVYAPGGISKQRIQEHFTDIQTYIRIFAPASKTRYLNFF
jgi:DNA/RNA-binding domain of Phe-tRNA-synthetase-like protein